MKNLCHIDKAVESPDFVAGIQFGDFDEGEGASVSLQHS